MTVAKLKVMRMAKFQKNMTVIIALPIISVRCQPDLHNSSLHKPYLHKRNLKNGLHSRLR